MIGSGNSYEAHGIRLYEKTMSLCPLYGGDAMRGMHLLEISCGHGGGLMWLGKTHAHLDRIVGESGADARTHEQASTGGRRRHTLPADWPFAPKLTQCPSSWTTRSIWC